MNRLYKIGIAIVGLIFSLFVYVQLMKTQPIFETNLSSDDLAKIQSARPNLVVDKSALRIFVIEDGQPKKREDGSFVSWKIALGGEPVGHKEKQGDKRTPEGLYRYSNYGGTYYGSLWIHYPNAQDVRQSFADGRLTESKRDALLKQIQRGETVDGGILGNAILIHGTHREIPKLKIGLPKMTDVRHIQTQGCVGMSNVDIYAMRDELESTSGTVLIVP